MVEDRIKYQPVSVGTWAGSKLSARERGYDSKWDRARLKYLEHNPLCVMCKAEGHIGAANTVDHIVPHRGDQKLFWDQKNWRSLCAHHHSSDAQRKDHGYGVRYGEDPNTGDTE